MIALKLQCWHHPCSTYRSQPEGFPQLVELEGRRRSRNTLSPCCRLRGEYKHYPGVGNSSPQSRSSLTAFCLWTLCTFSVHSQLRVTSEEDTSCDAKPKQKSQKVCMVSSAPFTELCTHRGLSRVLASTPSATEPAWTSAEHFVVLSCVQRIQHNSMPCLYYPH